LSSNEHLLKGTSELLAILLRLHALQSTSPSAMQQTLQLIKAKVIPFLKKKGKRKTAGKFQKKNLSLVEILLIHDLNTFFFLLQEGEP